MSINFGTSSLQTSTANQEILIPFKPVGYNGTFKATYLSFHNSQNCTVKINGSTTPLFIPAGGFEFNSAYELYSLVIVESGIQYLLSGVAADSPTTTSGSTSIVDIAGVIELSASPSRVILTSGQTSQITVRAVRGSNYGNIVNPSGTTYESANTSVCTVNSSGLIGYSGVGTTVVTVTNGSYADYIQVICN